MYVGNFDADGLNVNNNWDDNRNDNLGLASRRQSTPNRQAAGSLLSLLLFKRTLPAPKHFANFDEHFSERGKGFCSNGICFPGDLQKKL